MQIEELEGAFADFEDYTVQLAEKRTSLYEAFEPQSLDGQVLRLRAADGAGMGGAYASRRTEPLLELVRRALGPAWRVANHPLVREAMDAFDAIVLKVDRRAGVTPAPASGETEPDA